MTTPTPDPEFVAMLEEFMDANDEALRRLAGIPRPYVAAGREPSLRERVAAKLREAGCIGGDGS